MVARGTIVLKYGFYEVNVLTENEKKKAIELANQLGLNVSFGNKPKPEYQTNLCATHGRMRCGECAYVEQLEEENKKLKEALSFYADKDNTWHDGEYEGGLWISIAERDSGEIARNALNN